MGIFSIRQLIHFVRRESTERGLPATSRPNGIYHHILPTTPSTTGKPHSTCSIPLTFLATATGILFVFTCWLSTAGNLHTLYPSELHTFRNSIDVHDSLGIILRPRASSVYYGQHRLLDLQKNGKSENGIGKEIVRPEITQEEVVKEPESRGKSRLWFKAEYTVEIPVCEGEYAIKDGGACIHGEGKRKVDGEKNKSSWVPATESVRVSFCTGYGSEGGDGIGGGWEEENSWDYVFPPSKGPSGIHTAGEWLFGVDKRPLEKWRSVDIPGRRHDTSLRTHMTVPDDEGKPEWQFHLSTAGVSINADAWNVYEEEITVDVPIDKIQTRKSLLRRIFRNRDEPKTEVERVLMWRWKGRYGGCPGEMDGRGVVLEGTAEWLRDGEEEEEEEGEHSGSEDEN